MEEQKKKKILLTIKRWGDFIIYLSFIFIIFYLLPDNIENIFHVYYEDFGLVKYIAFISSISIIIWCILINIGGIPRIISNNLYIPTWLIILLGYEFIAIYLSFNYLSIGEIYSYKEAWVLLFCLSLNIILIVGIHLIRKIAKSKFLKINKEEFGFNKINLESLSKDHVELKKWLELEAPVNFDLFERTHIADNIVNSISNGKNVSLIGKYGSGKSTILNWVEDKFISTKNYNICRIDSWGRKKNELSLYILNSILNTIKSKIDILSFIYIPDSFLEAMTKVNKWLNLILLFSQFKKPVDILKELDDLLFVHNEKVVIIIEDVDRNLDETLLREELPALLARFKFIENIHFILAIDSESLASTWLYRVSDYTQNIPSIQNEPISAIIECFRKNILFEKDLKIDNYDNFNKRFFSQYYCSKGKYKRNFGNLYECSPGGILTKLLGNPRQLKTVLKETMLMWNNLCGEVNFDELLTLTTIKHCIPPLNQFIVNNINSLPDIKKLEAYSLDKEQKNNKQEDNKQKNNLQISNSLYDEFNKYISKKKTSLDIISCHILMSFLFPDWVNSNKVPITQNNDLHKPLQSISNPNPTNYWNRIQLGALTQNELSDNSFLKDFLNAKNSDKELTLFAQKVVENKLFAKKFEQFHKLISDENEYTRYASAIFKKILSKYNEKASSEISGFMELKNILNKMQIYPTETYNNWLYEELRKAIKVSLNFSNSLFYSFINGQYSNVHNNNDLKNYIEIARKIWKNDINTFINSIDSNTYSSLFQIMVSFPNECDTRYLTENYSNLSDEEKISEEIYRGKSGNNNIKYYIHPDSWKWLADILYDSLKNNQNKILPQVMYLLICYKDIYILNEKSIDSAYINHELGKRLWDKKYLEIVQCFAEFDEFTAYSDEELIFLMKTMKKLCQEYLNKTVNE